jgi:putative membrane protein
VSIRNYTPRRRERRGPSRFAKLILWGSLAVAIGFQISYPLLEGEALRLITIGTVYAAAFATLVNAYLSHGSTYVIRYFLLTFIFGLAIEHIGVTTGWPFGNYSYDISLGAFLFNIPLVVPFAWMMLTHPILIAARTLSPRWAVVVGGFALMSWDFFLDPQMVSAGRWRWSDTSPHLPFQPEIPLSNAFGWLLSGIILMVLLQIFLPRERRKNGVNTTAGDLLLFWTWFSGVVGNIFFFARPGVALVGGLCFGIFLFPYLVKRWINQQ